MTREIRDFALSFGYGFLIWLTTLLAGSFILAVMLTGLAGGILDFAHFVILIAAWYSVPAFVLLSLFMWVVGLLHISNRFKLLLILIFAFILCFSTFYYSIGDKEFILQWEGLVLFSFIIYCLTLLGSSAFFGMKFLKSLSLPK